MTSRINTAPQPVIFASRLSILFAVILAVARTSSAAQAPLVTAQAPVFAPKAGIYTSTQAVTISDATATATIYYTTNGSTPTTKSAKYSAPIKITTTKTIKAIAAVTGETTSAVATAIYTIETPAATPVFSPKPGAYSIAQKVTLSDTTSGAIIYYTTNGSTPTTKSTKYTSPIAVNTTETVKAIAVATGHTTSSLASATYSIESLAAPPVTSLPAGLYNTVQTVKLTDATKGSSIYYTLNGSTPTTASTKYTSAISITGSETLQAIAVAPGYIESKITSAHYRIIIETVLHSFNGGINGSTDAGYPQSGYNLIQANDGNFYGVSVYGGANASATEIPGAIFKLTPAGLESILYSFPQELCNPNIPPCPLPNQPTGGLIQAKDGNLYGAADGGGEGPGSIYRISLSGSPALVYEFGIAPDANASQVQLVQGRDGNFYGTSYDAGNYGWGAAFRLTPAGAETVLHSFGSATGCPKGPDGCQPDGALVEGADGAFYGTTTDGGLYGQGTFYKITTAGVETVLYSFGATSTDAIGPTGSLILGRDGNFYGTSNAGGNAPIGCSCGTVFKATPAGVVSVLYSFGGAYANGDGQAPNGSLIEGPDGNFYGTTAGGGSANVGQLGIVFEVTPAGVETILYTFQVSAGAAPDGGSPTSLILGSDGNFYGITSEGGAFGEGTIFKLTGVIPAS